MKNSNFLIDEFMIYCGSKNLSKKTMMSYEQTLRLFSKYLEEKDIIDITKVTEKVTEQAYLDLTDADIRRNYQQFSLLANMRGGRR